MTLAIVDPVKNISIVMETFASQKPQLHVAVGVVFNLQGQVLIAQRPKHTVGAGFWEFPGGKVEKDESVQTALHRELQEELNINVEFISPLIKFEYEYPDRSILLDVWEVIKYHGTPTGVEAQHLEWVEPEQLCDYQLLSANRPIVSSILLPPYYWISPEPTPDEIFLQNLENVLNKGIRLIQLCSMSLTAAEYRPIVEKSLALCRMYGAKLLLNHPQSLTIHEQTDADGIHLTSLQVQQYTERPVGKSYWVGASCQSAGDIRQAEKLNVDFLTLGPVISQSLHPEHHPLTWQNFTELIRHANLPVYAQGKLRVTDIQTAKLTGAQGIAGTSFMND